MSDSPPLSASRRLAFDAFHLDVAGHRLWRGDREIPLRPKAWDVLCYLVERPGLLVTKENLHRAIWPDVVVSDDTLTKSISELRQALDDRSGTPRIIQTVHGRGFRFVAEVDGLESDARGPRDRTPPPALTDDVAPEATGPSFVGRRVELGRLRQCLGIADRGTRQVVFITGEAGIGKTALSEEYLRSSALRRPDIWVLRGQCIQQHGQREPYGPLLEALERGLGSSVGSALIPLFRRVAPCWYAQIPWLLSEGEPKGFPQAMMTATPERMLREVGAFLESVASQATIVLLLEDLHWSDHATADLLLYLAQRRDPARLLIIGTFRPAEASTQDHPIREVRQTLRTRRRCVDLALDYLSLVDVRDYLQGRFGNDMKELAPLIHQRTDGNPLFVISIVEELIRRGQLTRSDSGWATSVSPDRLELAVPEDLLEMVTSQFQRLSAQEQSVLETASVIGVSFTPATLARALGRDAEEVDAVSQRMARAHFFLSLGGASGDRDHATRYDFSHALHHQVVYEQIPPLRRRRLHLSVAEALESSSGERVAELAPELSVHFERGDDPLRAARYLGMCAERALQRQAPREAIAYVELALDLLERIPDSPQRRQRELDLRILLGASLFVTRGPGSAAVRDNYERARLLCADESNARQLFEIIHAAWYAQMVGFNLEAAKASVEELAHIADGQTLPEFRLRAELAHGRTEFYSGHFGAAVRIFTQFLDAVAARPIERRAQTYGISPLIATYRHGCLALWFLGRPDQGRAWAQIGITAAEESREPFALASVLTSASFLQTLCGSSDEAAHLAARAATVSADHAIANFVPMSRFFGGAALAGQGDLEGGLAAMLPALAEHREVVGSLVTDIMFGLLAAAYAEGERWDEGLAWAAKGLELSATVREHVYAAELWRIKGELLFGKVRASGRKKGAGTDALLDTARRCLERSLKIARRQEAKSLELRSLMSLARMLQRGDKSSRTHRHLRSLLASFTEGFDTKDLREGQALLGT